MLALTTITHNHSLKPNTVLHPNPFAYAYPCPNATPGAFRVVPSPQTALVSPQAQFAVTSSEFINHDARAGQSRHPGVDLHNR